MTQETGPGEWVFLTYTLPRNPSAPRLALWRKLKRLGVAQLADGLVALPADARTREQLEWAAEEVAEVGGTAGVWLARPTTRAQERQLAAVMTDARTKECAWLIRRHLDRAAEFVFVTDPEDVPADATPFDMRGADLGHHAADCTFEAILRRHELADPVLRALSVAHDDHRVLELTDPIFDAVHDHLRGSLLAGTDPP